MKLALVLATLLIAAPSATAFADDAYVKVGSPIINVEPGTAYHFYNSPADLPADVRFSNDSITRMIQDFALAVSGKDTKAALGHFLPEAKITVREITRKGEVERELSPAKYAQFLRKVWQRARAYEFAIVEAGVVIAEDGKSAMLKAKVLEAWTIKGKKTELRSLLIADVGDTPSGPMVERMVIRGLD